MASSRSRRIRIGVYLFCAACLVWAFIEPHCLQFKRYTIASPDVPPSFDGLTIAFVTDVHRGPTVSQDAVRDLVDAVNARHPDLILLGGDYIRKGRHYIEPSIAELSRLRAPLGVYAVTGNHDHWEDGPFTCECLRRGGVGVLDDTGVWIARGRDRIRLGGVSDYWTCAPDIAPAVQGVRNTDFLLLLCHNPDYLESVRHDTADLILCGHTHGGQCSVLGLWAPLVPSRHGQKYRTGRIEKDGSMILVSNGTGVLAPVRFCTPPQVLWVTLKLPRMSPSP